LFFSSEYNIILLDNRYKVTCTNTGISRTNRFPYDKIQIKCTEQSFLGRISLYQRTKPCLPPKIGEKIRIPTETINHVKEINLTETINHVEEINARVPQRYIEHVKT